MQCPGERQSPKVFIVVKDEGEEKEGGEERGGSVWLDWALVYILCANTIVSFLS